MSNHADCTLALDSPARRLVSQFLQGRTEATRRGYAADLRHFARFAEAADPIVAIEKLIANGHGQGNATALAFKTDMLDRGLSPATVNRRLAAVRSVVRMARLTGMVAWALDIPNAPSQSYRDTSGPTWPGYQQMLAAARRRTGQKAVRDLCVLKLLGERGLRCVEVCRLNLDDVNLESATLMVLGKGRREREPVTVAPPTVAALKKWISARGTEPGPLFVTRDRAHSSQRLSVGAVYDLVVELAGEAKVRCTPHALRHSAITRVLDQGVDVRTAQKFSRHRDLRVLTVYDDQRSNAAGVAALAIAEAEAE